MPTKQLKIAMFDVYLEDITDGLSITLRLDKIIICHQDTIIKAYLLVGLLGRCNMQFNIRPT